MLYLHRMNNNHLGDKSARGKKGPLRTAGCLSARCLGCPWNNMLVVLRARTKSVVVTKGMIFTLNRSLPSFRCAILGMYGSENRMNE
jgi:hypothetical protein